MLAERRFLRERHPRAGRILPPSRFHPLDFPLPSLTLLLLLPSPLFSLPPLSPQLLLPPRLHPSLRLLPHSLSPPHPVRLHLVLRLPRLLLHSPRQRNRRRRRPSLVPSPLHQPPLHPHRPAGGRIRPILLDDRLRVLRRTALLGDVPVRRVEPRAAAAARR